MIRLISWYRFEKNPFKGEIDPPPLKISYIEELIKKGTINFSGKREHNLTFLAGEKLGKTLHSLVWKVKDINSNLSIWLVLFDHHLMKFVSQFACIFLGFYNGDAVAIKIIWQKKSFDREIEILKALNAIEDLEIERRGVPRLYYHGPFLRKYRAIAMTLFDGTLKDRCKSTKMPITDVNILMWFRRAVWKFIILN